ncbi:hypothetical protein D3C78_1248480 [compost metagenome]
MPMPGIDLLVRQEGEAQQQAIVAHHPQDAIRRQSEGHVLHAVPAQQVRRQHAHILRLEPVRHVVVGQGRQLSAASLHVERGVGVDRRSHIAGAEIALLDGRDVVLRDAGLGAAGNRDLGAGGHGEKITQRNQVADLVDLFAGDDELQSVIVLAWLRIAEVVEIPRAAHPDRLRIRHAGGEDHALLEEPDHRGIVAADERVVTNRDSVLAIRRDVDVTEAGGR